MYRKDFLKLLGLGLIGCNKDMGKQLFFGQSQNSGGGGGTFDPTTISGLIAWYDVNNFASITKDGSNLVSQLSDLSGGSNHLVQAAGGNQPTYHATGGANNKPYITFTSGKNLLKSSFTHSQPYTVYAVLKQNSMVSSGNLVSFQSGATFNGLVQMHDATYGDFFCPAAGIDLLDTNNYYKNGDYAVFRFTVNGATSLAGINREPNHISAYNIGTTGTTQLQLGKDTSFDFHELLFYDGAIASTDDDYIMDGLSDKYARNNYDYICWLGDSITYGDHSTNNQLLSAAALTSKEKFKDYYNNGIQGAKLYQGSSSSGVSSLYKALKGTCTGWVVMWYCHNDGTVYNNGTWKSTYKTLIQNLKSAGYASSKIIINNHVYPDPAAAGGPYDYSYVVPMNTIIAQIASEEGIVLGDVYTYMQANGGTSLSYDGLHPNTSGHRAIADYMKTLIS